MEMQGDSVPDGFLFKAFLCFKFRLLDLKNADIVAAHSTRTLKMIKLI